MRTGLLIRSFALAGVLAACVASPAQSKELTNDQVSYLVFVDYQKDGEITPCAFTVGQLRTALNAITPDVRQYASDYPSAIRAAISARTRASCDGSGPAGGGTPGAAPGATGGGAPPPPPAATPAPPPGSAKVPMKTVVPEPPSPAGSGLESQAPSSQTAVDRAAASAPGGEAPAPLVGLGVLAMLLALTLAFVLIARRLGLQDGRLAPAYHSWREARWRAGGVWEDFRDWLRVGR